MYAYTLQIPFVLFKACQARYTALHLRDLSMGLSDKARKFNLIPELNSDAA
jgi:hypothetical protein